MTERLCGGESSLFEFFRRIEKKRARERAKDAPQTRMMDRRMKIQDPARASRSSDSSCT